MRQKSGISFLALYLKASSTYVMQFIANPKRPKFITSVTYGPHVSLTRSGLPRIIPVSLRRAISNNDTIIIKVVLTILNLYRVLPYPGKVKLSTITDKWNGSLPQGILSFIPIFWQLISPKPFTFIWNPFAIKASGSIINGKKTSSFSGFLKALLFLRRESVLWADLSFFFETLPSRRGWKARTQRAWEGLKDLSLILEHAFGHIASEPLGKLAFKEEPGKVRVFAMADCITQWVLHPLHQWLFTVLRTLSSTDATFDQKAGTELLLSKIIAGKRVVYSLDLSAATDRLPLILQVHLLNHIFPKLGDHWGSLLINRDYSVPNHKTLKFHKDLKVRYGTGQPMGAYSSWAMLALTHHFIVQFCAYKIYHKKIWFRDYMILGDDLLLLDSKVAKEYLKVMKQLDVGVNLSKSLISSIGIGEFAKKLLSPSGLIQGLSLREFSSLGKSFSNVLNISLMLNAKTSAVLRLLGFGSKSVGHSPKNFTSFSMRALLDHILISPLAKKEGMDWFNWFSYIGKTKYLDIGDLAPTDVLYYFLWGKEVEKAELADEIGRKATDLSWDKMGPYASMVLFNYWIPSQNGNILMSEDQSKLLDFLQNKLSGIFLSSSVFAEMIQGASPDLVPRCLNLSLSVDDDQAFGRFSLITNEYLWSIISRNPKSWIAKNYLGKDYFDIKVFMQQVPSEDFFKIHTLKDVSLALKLKKDFFKFCEVYKDPSIQKIEQCKDEIND